MPHIPEVHLVDAFLILFLAFLGKPALLFALFGNRLKKVVLFGDFSQAIEHFQGPLIARDLKNLFELLCVREEKENRTSTSVPLSQLAENGRCTF